MARPYEQKDKMKTLLTTTLAVSFLLASHPLARQGFGAEQVIATSANYPRSIFATDLDGDGDADVLSASSFDNNLRVDSRSKPK